MGKKEKNKIKKKPLKEVLLNQADQLDILAFGAHPDDVEIGMGASLKKWADRGYKVGICDLTNADLSSNGNVRTRVAEAKKAAEILGVRVRIIVGLLDRGLFLTDDAIRKIVPIIRQYQPKLVFAPFEVDRHPDHGNCTRLIEEAYFSAGIRRYQKEAGERWHAKGLYYYMINGFHHPDFVVDVTETMEAKLDALRAYESQFTKQEGAVDTPLTNGYIDSVRSREALFGQEVGTSFAEGFKTKTPLLWNHPLGEWV